MSVNVSATKLCEMICTRISHDLIGNIGAVSNAVELLDEDPDCAAEIKPILEISSGTLTARLKFFRLAFGLDNACPQNIDELYRIASGYLATIGGRSQPITLEMQAVTPQLYKIILPAIMALGDVFVRGGNLKIIANDKGLSVVADSSSNLSGGKLEALKRTLEGHLPEDNPSQTAPLLYLQKLLEDKQVQINLSFVEQQAVLTIA